MGAVAVPGGFAGGWLGSVLGRRDALYRRGRFHQQRRPEAEHRSFNSLSKVEIEHRGCGCATSVTAVNTVFLDILNFSFRAVTKRMIGQSRQ